MMLLLDAGNSRYKIAELQETGVANMQSFAYGTATPANAVIKFLERSTVLPERIMIASVLGKDFRQTLTAWTEAHYVSTQFVMTTDDRYGVQVAYDEPRRLGVDRYLAMIGAHHEHAGASIIIDCGTAITIDALTAEGKHLGGLIIPGLRLMRSALLDATHGIDVKYEAQPGLFGRDTETAVHGGSVHAVVTAIDHIPQAMAAQMQGPVRNILTGGDAGQVAPLLMHSDYELAPTLVLQGLAIMANTQ